MAKKVTIESLKDELSKLEAQEQTAAVMEKIDSLKSRIETMEAEDKALVEEIARNEAEKAAKKAKKDDDDDKKEVDFEEWKLERSVIQGQVRYERVKKIKECKMLKEHADELNLQKENRLFEYIKIK